MKFLRFGSMKFNADSHSDKTEAFPTYDTAFSFYMNFNPLQFYLSTDN